MESHQGLWGPYTLFPCWVFQWSQAFLCLRTTSPPLKVSGGIVKCEVFVHSMLPTGRVCGHSLCSRQQGSLLGSHRYPRCLQCLSRWGDDNTQTRLPDRHGATHCPFSGGSGAPPPEQASASGKAFLAGNLHSLMMVVIVGRSRPDQGVQVAIQLGRKRAVQSEPAPSGRRLNEATKPWDGAFHVSSADSKHGSQNLLGHGRKPLRISPKCWLWGT